MCEAGDPIAPTRAGEERERPGSRVPRSGFGARRAAAGSPSAGAHHKLGGPAPHLLTPARGEPRGGRRKRSRRPLLPPPPPLPEPGAPAGEGGEVVPGDFSWPPASPGAKESAGWGGRAGYPGWESVCKGGPKAAGSGRITATRSRVQHSKFQESSSLLPSFPKSLSSH